MVAFATAVLEVPVSIPGSDQMFVRVAKFGCFLYIICMFLQKTNLGIYISFPLPVVQALFSLWD